MKFVSFLSIFECQMHTKLKAKPQGKVKCQQLLQCPSLQGRLVYVSTICKVHIPTLKRPQNFAKSPSYFCLYVLQTNVRWRFRKTLWPSQNIQTLTLVLLFICFGELKWVPSEKLFWNQFVPAHFLQLPTPLCHPL